MEERIARIETHVEHINGDVADLRASVTRLDAKIDALGQRLDAKIGDFGNRLDGRVDALAAKLDRHFLVLGGMIVSLAVGMAGLMAKGFHWL